MELAVLAVFAILANLTFFGVLVQQMHESSWVYHALMQNPRSYGREIDPVTIASLGNRPLYWTAAIVFGSALAFGMFLAIHLLVTVSLVDRNRMAEELRLIQYRRWKPVGIALTWAALTWFGHENFDFWVDATRHIPQGSDNYIENIIIDAAFISLAVLPWWLIGKRTWPEFGGHTPLVQKK
ncbi:MAG TPA: hypothetical protein VHD56_14810 [Tepidisphaeraceae bacterium]|nr:hypothetical protein [Tepidisphaeraceae bacterium]